MAKIFPGNTKNLPEENRSSQDLKKALYALIASLLLLLPPLFNLLESLQFSKNAVRGEARIVEYKPQIIGKAGGRREIKDFYQIGYEGIKKEVQIGSRIVTSKEKVAPPEKGSPFKVGDAISIAYLKKDPVKLIINPEENLLSHAYHAHRSIALFYLLKMISLTLLVVSVQLFRRSFKNKI